MELYIAGGCNEHGRNCFLVKGNRYSLLVDCGIKEGASQPYPILTQDEIKRISYVFLTHSHKDHVGALSWIEDLGFTGATILTRATFEQMSVKPKRYIIIDELVKKNTLPLERDLSVSYGKSGHCEGSVWYQFIFEGKRLLFSGDYIESSEVYACDPIEGFHSDLAILDCAYMKDSVSAKDHQMELVKHLNESIKEKKLIVLPVPKYGRGLDLLKLVMEQLNVKSKVQCYLDTHMYEYVRGIQNNDWFQSSLKKKKSWKVKELQNINQLQSARLKGDMIVLFLSDPQLVKKENQELCNAIYSMDGEIIFTGNLDEGSYSRKLVEDKKAVFYRYHVHMNLADVKRVCERNQFERVVLSHSIYPIKQDASSCDKEELKDYLCLDAGQSAEF